MGTADAIASVLAITKLRVKLGQNSSLKRSQSPVKEQNLKLHVRLGQCYVKLHHGTGDAIAFFIGWVKICPPNSPTVQFGTALSKSPPRLHY